jgi:hypothetical protein
LQAADLEVSMQKIVVPSIDEALESTIDRKEEENDAEKLLADARDLARGLSTRAQGIEQERRIPWDIIDSLRACGLFKMLVPYSHGGLGLSVPDILPAITALSAADGSVGWIAMVAASSQMFCSRLPRAIYGGLFANGAEPLVVGVGTPAGQAEKVAGGYRVTGRWPFASGCQDAQWIIGHCVVFERSIMSRYRNREPAIYSTIRPVSQVLSRRRFCLSCLSYMRRSPSALRPAPWPTLRRSPTVVDASSWQPRTSAIPWFFSMNWDVPAQD